MHDRKRGFTLAGRLILLIGSSVVVVGILITLARAFWFRQIPMPGPVSLFLVTVLFCMGCGGIWLSLVWKSWTPDRLAEAEFLPSPGQPEIPGDAVAYRFPGVRLSAVFIDVEGQVVYFQNCHAPRTFFSRAAEWFSCPVADIRGVHTFRQPGPRHENPESVTVVTATGKAVIPDMGPGYDEMRDVLKELVPATRPGHSADQPEMPMAAIAGALLGIAGGYFCTPQNAGDEVLALCVVAGAFLGVIATYALVLFGDRVLQFGFAQPIGYAVTGALIGAPLLIALQGWLWNVQVIPVGVSACALVGAVFGAWKQAREQGPSRDSD